ncbi:hypothetical protein CHU32_27580 [Superficieibacter electus]|uniref:Immunity MXAN-0049 protein domain-containing protein n=1 Tax=Superficieibacter electus TaxID=2022662 RepID=A0A2P5GGN2_9ENTR|nr:DUF1629 domain-containing protein [Superficieibacter electus]POP40411.1 hypothetical protein CHU33_27490 [Superficieibacter electus]POP40870.1 hypothetical protein CHU32_27580 [Superficieibacter electus]
MYMWSIPEQYPNKHIGGYQYDIVSYFLFNRSIHVEKMNIHPVINYKADLNILNKYDCLPNNSLIPVINERLKIFLEAHSNNNVEFYKVDIHANDGLLKDFYILNVITKLPLINLRNSICEYIPNTEKAIMGFKKVSFIKNPPGDFSIARCSEYLSYLMLSDELVVKMKKEKFKGVAYSKITETSSS